MPTSEKLCLRWNDFQENVNNAFATLRKDSDFTDVTLACKDGQQVKAHKVILAASSPFFQNLLKSNKHTHPLIYMRGINAEDLLAIVDFLYYGEANIYQENLDRFLSIAEELELKGLNGREEGGGRGDGETTQQHNYQNTPPSARTQKNHTSFETKTSTKKISFPSRSYTEDQISSSTAVALPKHQFSGDMKELDELIETMMRRGENMIRQGPTNMIKAYVCQDCGKEGQRCDIKNHIEANHLEGISIPCSFCEKTFRSRDSLRHHIINHNFSNNL